VAADSLAGLLLVVAAVVVAEARFAARFRGATAGSSGTWSRSPDTPSLGEGSSVRGAAGVDRERERSAGSFGVACRGIALDCPEAVGSASGGWKRTAGAAFGARRRPSGRGVADPDAPGAVGSTGSAGGGPAGGVKVAFGDRRRGFPALRGAADGSLGGCSSMPTQPSPDHAGAQPDRPP
jgi:hypothetical protein